MGQLGVSIDKLDRTLRDVYPEATPAQRDLVINELNKMEKIAFDLGAGTQATNHLFLDQHIDQFKQDVTNARQAVEAEPANFYLAGKLAGSCLGCHVQKGGG